MSDNALITLALFLLALGAFAEWRRPRSLVGEALADVATWAGLGVLILWATGGAR